MSHKLFLFFLLSIFISPIKPSIASELVPFSAAHLNKSNYIFVGKITDIKAKQKNGFFESTIQVISVIKGKIKQTSLKFVMDTDSLTGFDILLKKDDLAIFFASSIEGKYLKLVAPGATPTLSNIHFK